MKKVITLVFLAGKQRDFDLLYRLHSNDERFSKFDDSAPYRRQSYSEAMMYEEAAFAGISDYDFDVDDLRIDFFSEIAVATFYVKYRGMVVDNYSFRGQTFKAESRATMVLLRTAGSWVITHEHLSRIPSYQPP